MLLLIHRIQLYLKMKNYLAQVHQKEINLPEGTERVTFMIINSITESIDYVIKFEIYSPNSFHSVPHIVKRVFKNSNRIGEEKIIDSAQGAEAFKIAYRNIGDTPLKCTYYFNGACKKEDKKSFPFIQPTTSVNLYFHESLLSMKQKPR